MRLRTAIKIQKQVEGYGRFTYRRYNWQQIETSRRICRRKWIDRRVPYIPDEDEIRERGLWRLSILAGCVIDDSRELEVFREQLWR